MRHTPKRASASSPRTLNHRNKQTAGDLIVAQLIRSDACTALGISVRGVAPVLELCRQLIAAGHDPATPLHAYRGDVLCVTVPSIGEAAQITIHDNRHGMPIFRRAWKATLGVATSSPMRDFERAGTGDRAAPHNAIPDERTVEIAGGVS
jgi:hypothetical protein